MFIFKSLIQLINYNLKDEKKRGNGSKVDFMTNSNLFSDPLSHY